MKNLAEIWQEYINKNQLSVQTLSDLIWHLECDADPIEAIIMATDIAVEIELKELYPYIAKHLDNEDDAVRELTVGYVLGRLKLVEYAEKGFQMALEDSDDTVRGSATFSIGGVLNKIQDKTLQHKIAIYLYRMLVDPERDILCKGEAYRSILTAMEVPELEQPRVRDLGKEIDFDLVKNFREKYGIARTA